MNISSIFRVKRNYLVPRAWPIAISAFIAIGLNASPSHQELADEMKTHFMPITELDPFIVKGEELSVSVFARRNSDRNYGERFAESVVEVAYETIEKSTGHGLVIVGDKKDPHPLFVFRKFLELDENNQLNTDLTGAAQELREMLDELKKLVPSDEESQEQQGNDEDFNLDFEDIARAFPLPLEGVARHIYMVAWSEKFDEDRLDERLKEITAEDLQENQLSKYNWVFYLPPKDAFKKVLKTAIPEIMKEAELGFFKRAALRGAIVTFKPLIKDAVEGARKCVLYYTVLRSNGSYSDGDIAALTGAYAQALMPKGKIIPGNKKKRAIEAIEKQKIKNEEYAKDPFVPLEPIEDYEVSHYEKFIGQYGDEGKMIHFFTKSDEAFQWQRKDEKVNTFYPATERHFISENGKISIEFILDEGGLPQNAKVKWDREKYIVPRML